MTITDEDRAAAVLLLGDPYPRCRTAKPGDETRNDKCSQCGDIDTFINIAGHLQDVHGLEYKHWVKVTTGAEKVGVPLAAITTVAARLGESAVTYMDKAIADILRSNDVTTYSLKPDMNLACDDCGAAPGVPCDPSVEH